MSPTPSADPQKRADAINTKDCPYCGARKGRPCIRAGHGWAKGRSHPQYRSYIHKGRLT